jgi:hypothetical protein
MGLSKCVSSRRLLKSLLICIAIGGLCSIGFLSIPKKPKTLPVPKQTDQPGWLPWSVIDCPHSVTTMTNAAPDPEAVVEKYNKRQEARQGGARRLEILGTCPSTLSDAITIIHWWTANGSEVRSVFAVEKPEPLHGYAILLVESNSLLNAYLHLPGATDPNPIAIAPEYFAEPIATVGLSYLELRMTLPLIPGSCSHLDTSSSNVLLVNPTVTAAFPAFKCELNTAEDFIVALDTYTTGISGPATKYRALEMSRINAGLIASQSRYSRREGCQIDIRRREIWDSNAFLGLRFEASELVHFIKRVHEMPPGRNLASGEAVNASLLNSAPVPEAR